MPILGSIDSADFTATVAVENGTTTVTKGNADTIVAGDIIVLDGVQYYTKVVEGNTITLGKAYAGSTNATLAANKVQRRTAPKALADFLLSNGTSTASTTSIVGVSQAEAQLSENKARGISSPGWWAYRTYTDAAGSTRHKSELITSYKDGTAFSGDFTDDTIAGDVTSLITIDTQPANQNTSSGAATFTVAASSTGSGASLTYQWQKLDVTGGEWTDVSGATSASLVLASQTADETGDKYRAKVNNSIGGVEVITDGAATLTFVS